MKTYTMLTNLAGFVQSSNLTTISLSYIQGQYPHISHIYSPLQLSPSVLIGL